MDVCHRVIDMPPAVAATNHTAAIVVQQPSDKQHDKHSHLWGHPSPTAPQQDLQRALLPPRRLLKDDGKGKHDTVSARHLVDPPSVRVILT